MVAFNQEATWDTVLGLLKGLMGVAMLSAIFSLVAVGAASAWLPDVKLSW